MNVTFTILIAFITSFTAFITFTGDIIKKPNPNIPKERGVKLVTTRGWIYIISSVILIALYPVQSCIQSKDEAKRDSIITKALSDNYNTSVFKMKRGFDVSSQNLTNIVSTTLGKYGYALDTTKKELKVMIDSAKTREINNDAPVLEILSSDGSDGIKPLKVYPDKTKYLVEFTSIDAGSSFFKLKTSIVIDDSTKGLLYMGCPQLLYSNDIIPKNLSYDSYINIPNILKYSKFYIFVRGEFKNIDNTKKYTVDRLYFYDKLPQSGNKFGIINGNFKNKIESIIKQKEVLTSDFNR